MQVFKAALRVFTKHPVYIVIYIVWLSFMAVFIGSSNVSAPVEDFEETRPAVAIVDRDGSALSEGVAAFVAEHGDLVEIEDTRLAMQDAAAQNYAQYILIIPQGFGADFMAASENGTQIPALETVTSYESIAANMMSSLVDEYLGTAKLYVASGATDDEAKLVEMTSADMANAATVSVVQLGESAPVSQQWTLYMQFSGYTIMLSIIVCLAVLMGAFNRTDIRRRDLTSPISTLSMNLQIAAACLLIMLLCWAWVCVLGLIVYGQSLANVDPRIIGLVMLSLLAFCTIPLAIGFFLGQITTNEMVMNAAGNIIGLAFSFLGGIWISLDLMGETVVAIAHFIPTFYYGDAVRQAINLHGFSPASVSPIFADMGIMLLFAAAIIAVALVAGRLRMQSSEAGGNAAAARVAS